MAAHEHKVFDLELVGVPVRKRRPWPYAIAVSCGLLTGVMLMVLFGGRETESPDPGPRADTRPTDAALEQAARAADVAALQTRLSSLDSEVQTARAELLQVRGEHDQLLRAYERLRLAYDRKDAELAGVRRQLAQRGAPAIAPVEPPSPSVPVRRPGSTIEPGFLDPDREARPDVLRPGTSRPGNPQPANPQPWAPTLGDERSPPPLGPAASTAPVGRTDNASRARRIFVVPMAGIRLSDVARLYDVTVQQLRVVNPELAGAEQDFLSEGTRVRIPNAGR